MMWASPTRHPGGARMTSELRSDHGFTITSKLCLDHYGFAAMTCRQRPDDVQAKLILW
jgi:hypothetical protein